jgi:hypothetical protein
MTDRIIAECRDYLSFIQGLRARLAELKMTYETLDVIAGWTDTYSTKLLAPEPTKHFGPMSFDAVLGSTAVKILLIEDPVALKRILNNRHYTKRKMPDLPSMRPVGKHGHVVHRITHENMKQLSFLGNQARMLKLSPKRRRALARRAARVRWRRKFESAPTNPK